MADKEKPVAVEQSQVETDQQKDLPDEERRRILGKLATGAFVIPLVLLVLDGGDSISYGY